MVINTHKAIFEVITLNLLYELEKRNLYKEAAVLLCEFNDWDSLLSSLVNILQFFFNENLYFLFYFLRFCQENVHIWEDIFIYRKFL